MGRGSRRLRLRTPAARLQRVDASADDRSAWHLLSREVPIDPAHAALLFVDVQNYNARPDGGEYAALTEAERDARYGWFFRTMRETALPNMQRLQAACRRRGSR